MFLRNGLIFMFGFFVSETAEQTKTKYIITYERKFVKYKKILEEMQKWQHYTKLIQLFINV